MTELYNAQQELIRENIALKEVNIKLSELLERLSDHIREEETLALNRRLHNEISGGLTEISALLEGGEDALSQSKDALERLSDALGYFRADLGENIRTGKTI